MGLGNVNFAILRKLIAHNTRIPCLIIRRLSGLWAVVMVIKCRYGIISYHSCIYSAPITR